MTDLAVLTVNPLPIDRVLPADDNMRDDLGDLGDLAASIKAVGILEPLLVTPIVDKPDHWRIVAGHRRHAAGVLAELRVVPAIIRPDLVDETEHVVRLIENLHRKDLTPLERAKRFRQLIDAGKTQTEVAELVGVSQATVSKSLGVLELPVKIAAKVGVGGDDGIPIDNVADLLKLKDHPKELDEVVKQTEPGPNNLHGGWSRSDLPYAVEDTLDRIERDAKVAEFEQQIKDKGWKKVKVSPNYNKSYVPLKTAVDGYFYDITLDVDKTKHRKEPCHGAYVGTNGNKPKLVEVCTKAERHKAKGDSNLKAKTPAKPQRSPHEQKQLDDQKARKAAFVRRAEHLQPLLTKGGGKLPVKTVDALVSRMLIDSVGAEEHKAACALLGLEVTSYCEPSLLELATESDRELTRIAVACGLAIGHVRAKANWHSWESDDVGVLYEFLRATGYKPGDFEIKQLTPAPPPKRRPATPRRGKSDPTENGTGAHAQIPPSTDVETAQGPPEAGELNQGIKTDGLGRGLGEIIDDVEAHDLGDGVRDLFGDDDPAERAGAYVDENISEPVTRIERRKKVFVAICSEHGDLGQAPSTTEAYAQQVIDRHLMDEHRVSAADIDTVDPAEPPSLEDLVEVMIEQTTNETRPWNVTCSEHGACGRLTTEEAAHQRATSHIDHNAHAQLAVIVEKPLTPAGTGS